MIVTKNITKKFNNKPIFENLNFSAKKSTITTIVGQSGKGKTTFLRILSNLEKVDEGTILIDKEPLVEDGKYVNHKKQKQILSKIGMIFQHFNLFPNLNVINNMLIVKDDLQKAENLLERFNLSDKKNEPVSHLSGGQKQRLSIIRALMNDPEIIFFDEPTSALDEQNFNSIVNLILELKEKNYTILVVTHDLKLVENLNCDVFDFNKI